MNIYDQSDPTVEKDYYLVSVVKAKTLDKAIRLATGGVGSQEIQLELSEDLSEAMIERGPVLHLEDYHTEKDDDQN